MAALLAALTAALTLAACADPPYRVDGPARVTPTAGGVSCLARLGFQVTVTDR